MISLILHSLLTDSDVTCDTGAWRIVSLFRNRNIKTTVSELVFHHQNSGLMCEAAHCYVVLVDMRVVGTHLNRLGSHHYKRSKFTHTHTHNQFFFFFFIRFPVMNLDLLAKMTFTVEGGLLVSKQVFIGWFPSQGKEKNAGNPCTKCHRHLVQGQSFSLSPSHL